MREKLADKFICTTFLMLALFVVNSFAQKDVTTKIDEFIKSEMQRQNIPGLSLAIIKDGRIIHTKGYGLANLEHQVPVKPETVFQSGSIGKQFVATAVMLLVEEGKLSLGDKITKYFLDAPESWKNITLRHLLTHTSGMDENADNYDLKRDYTEEELIKIIKRQPLIFQPGEKWSYSNLGYITLGILIGKVTGKFYGNFLKERIFEPLGMTTTQIITETDIVPNRAAGYRLVNGELKNQEWVAPTVNTTADGSLYLTIQDMAKWDAALNSEKLLKKASLQEMWTHVQLTENKNYGYGFGWFTDKIQGHSIIHHGGVWQGFTSYITRFIDEKLTIVFFTNRAFTNIWKVTRGLSAIFYSEFALPAVQLIEDKEQDVTRLAKRILHQLMTNTPDKNLFTAEMQASFFSERASQINGSINKLSLPIAIIYTTTELVERREESSLRVYRYMLTDLGASRFLTLKLTKENKIAGIEFEEK